MHATPLRELCDLHQDASEASWDMAGIAFKRFRLTDKWSILVLALVSFGLHLGAITYFPYFIFDELIYGPEAVRLLAGGTASNPHLSLGKLFIEAGIYFFGFGPWGWRLFTVIFGTAGMVFFYLICRRLGGQRVALLASFLLLFENLTFVHSSLGMLDIFSITFMLLSFLLYLQNRHALSGVSLALGGLCKITGLLGGLVILTHWLCTSRTRRGALGGVLRFSASVFVAFFLLMPVTDFLATGEWVEPFHRFYYSSIEHSNLGMSGFTTSHSHLGLSYSWEWILKPIQATYLPPPSYFMGIITPTIWVLIIPSMAYMYYEWRKNRSGLAVFSLLWFAGTFLLWIPYQLVTDKVSYLYYFLPTVGAVCMAIGFGLHRVLGIAAEAKDTVFGWLLRAGVFLYLALHMACFFLFSPLIAVVFPQVG